MTRSIPGKILIPSATYLLLRPTYFELIRCETFLTNSVPSSNFAYSATARSRPVLYHHNTLFYSHYNTMLPICIKVLYHPSFFNFHICALGLTIHQGL